MLTPCKIRKFTIDYSEKGKNRIHVELKNLEKMKPLQKWFGYSL